MARPISAMIPKEMLERVDRILAERRKSDPMVTRADVIRELISDGLSHAKEPVQHAFIPKAKA